MEYQIIGNPEYGKQYVYNDMRLVGDTVIQDIPFMQIYVREYKNEVEKPTEWHPTNKYLGQEEEKIYLYSATTRIMWLDMNMALKAGDVIKIDKYTNIKINLPSEYNYMSKNQIYRLRIKYVKDSLFYNANYEPSEEVFGQIVDGKPWWGLISCDELNYKGDYHQRIEGDSKVSVQMNNPNALVGLSMPYLPWSFDYNKEFCTGEYSKFIPLSLKYSENNKIGRAHV